MDKKVIYTLGYTLFQKGAFFDIEKMFRVLKEHGITCLIDVRSIPFSKQYPQCNSDNLKITSFKNPDDKIVIVILNKENYDMNYSICINDSTFHDTIERQSIITYVID